MRKHQLMKTMFFAGEFAKLRAMRANVLACPRDLCANVPKVCQFLIFYVPTCH